jgi:hypothetical protein
MSTLDPRDRSLEQLLRQSSRPSSVSDHCVDGETLAAWVEGTLPVSSAATVEQHLADCARCQALLAAFVRSEPPMAATPHTRWWHLRWLVPLATAATAVAVWVAIPTDRHREITSLAKQESAEMRLGASNVSAPVPVPADAAEEKAFVAPSQGRPRQITNLGVREADQRSQKQIAATEAAGDAPRKAKDGTSARADSVAGYRAETAPGAVVAAPPLPAAPPPLPAPANTSPNEPERQAAADERRAAERPREAAQATAAPPATLAMMERSAPVEFAAPAASRRWRIVNGTRIERSTDGLVWEAAQLAVPRLIVAGHAPSTNVAWVVGRAGAIFVTTDGTRFESVPFPEPVDLVTVAAIDDRQASVTTADGRRFATSDRGASWRRQ